MLGLLRILGNALLNTADRMEFGEEFAGDGDVQQQVKKAVKRGRERRQAVVQEYEDGIERDRSRIAEKYESHVDRIIAKLPAVIEEAIGKDKFTRWRYILVEKVNIREMRDHDCGTAKPREGTYVEYLYNRLAEAGFSPECEYDDWPPGSHRWFGMMCIQVTKES